ncbi:MAG: alpha/beta hydrolase [Actinomycetota bacterium]|nr:alpha/beta hydrolase [Actinomycetota bacterium]
MGPENVTEFAASVLGAEVLTPLLESEAAALAHVSADEVAASFGELVSEVDRASLTGEFAEVMADGFHRALSTGVAGWRDDDLAFVRPWGFELSAIAVPVAVWQGAQDRMVPFAHGTWLAAHVPGARVHLYDDEGHLSLVGQLDRILDDLVELAGPR